MRARLPEGRSNYCARFRRMRTRISRMRHTATRVVQPESEARGDRSRAPHRLRRRQRAAAERHARGLCIGDAEAHARDATRRGRRPAVERVRRAAGRVRHVERGAADRGEHVAPDVERAHVARAHGSRIPDARERVVRHREAGRAAGIRARIDSRHAGRRTRIVGRIRRYVRGRDRGASVRKVAVVQSKQRERKRGGKDVVVRSQ